MYSKQPFWLLYVLCLPWTNIVWAVEYPDFVALVEQYSPAVVSVQTKTDFKERLKHGNPTLPKNSPFYDYFKHFFDEMPDIPAEQHLSVGSGFIISSDGYVVTNAHVVEDVSDIVVGLSDGYEINAQLIGKDERSDIALLKVKTEITLPAVKFGDVHRAKVGQWVLAIGSPFGFESTATQGIISALGRNLPSDNYVSFIQTDAAINPGNSGGPLFNLDGEVIGVNSQIYSRSGGYQGVSFAIPIDIAMEVVDQLKNSGTVNRGWLGIQIQALTPELGKSFGLEKPHGALVGQILSDGPAQSSGIKVGDIIIAFNGQAVQHSSDLPMMVGRTRPGTSVLLTVIRDGKERHLTVQISQLPDESKLQNVMTGSHTNNRLGLVIEKLPLEKRKQGNTGVLVKDVDEGPAAKAGIRPGDVIIRINNIDVSDVNKFSDLIEQLPINKPIPVLILREDGALFLALTIPK